MSATPTKLEKPTETSLRITWSDGMVREYTLRELREACPCATCLEKRNAAPPPANELPVMQPGQGGAQTLVSMRPVGNYAYQLTYGDGHDSGIYMFELLRRLGREAS